MSSLYGTCSHTSTLLPPLQSKLPPNPDGTIKGLDPILYCTEWFMSVFSRWGHCQYCIGCCRYGEVINQIFYPRSLPWPTVLRVWDMFFFEGVKVLFKVALALLNLAFSAPKSQKECTG